MFDIDQGVVKNSTEYKLLYNIMEMLQELKSMLVVVGSRNIETPQNITYTSTTVDNEPKEIINFTPQEFVCDRCGKNKDKKGNLFTKQTLTAHKMKCKG